MDTTYVNNKKRLYSSKFNKYKQYTQKNINANINNALELHSGGGVFDCFNKYEKVKHVIKCVKKINFKALLCLILKIGGVKLNIPMSYVKLNDNIRRAQNKLNKFGDFINKYSAEKFKKYSSNKTTNNTFDKKYLITPKMLQKLNEKKKLIILLVLTFMYYKRFGISDNIRGFIDALYTIYKELEGNKKERHKIYEDTINIIKRFFIKKLEIGGDDEYKLNDDYIILKLYSYILDKNQDTIKYKSLMQETKVKSLENTKKQIDKLANGITAEKSLEEYVFSKNIGSGDVSIMPVITTLFTELRERLDEHKTMLIAIAKKSLKKVGAPAYTSHTDTEIESECADNINKIKNICTLITRNLLLIKSEDNKPLLVNKFRIIFSEAKEITTFATLTTYFKTMYTEFSTATCETPEGNQELNQVYTDIEKFLTDNKTIITTVVTFINEETTKLEELNTHILTIKKLYTPLSGGSIRKIKQYTQNTRKTKIQNTQFGGSTIPATAPINTDEYIDTFLAQIEQINQNILVYMTLLKENYNKTKDIPANNFYKDKHPNDAEQIDIQTQLTSIKELYDTTITKEQTRKNEMTKKIDKIKEQIVKLKKQKGKTQISEKEFTDILKNFKAKQAANDAKQKIADTESKKIDISDDLKQVYLDRKTQIEEETTVITQQIAQLETLQSKNFPSSALQRCVNVATQAHNSAGAMDVIIKQNKKAVEEAGDLVDAEIGKFKTADLELTFAITEVDTEVKADNAPKATAAYAKVTKQLATITTAHIDAGTKKLAVVAAYTKAYNGVNTELKKIFDEATQALTDATTAYTSLTPPAALAVAPPAASPTALALTAWKQMLDDVEKLKNDTETIFTNANTALGNVKTSVVDKADTDVNGLITLFTAAKKNAAEANINYDGLVNKNIAVEQAGVALANLNKAKTHKANAEIASTTAATESGKVTSATTSYANITIDYNACKTAKELASKEAQLAITEANAAQTAATEAETASNKIILTTHPLFAVANTAKAGATAYKNEAKTLITDVERFADEAKKSLAAATTQYDIITKSSLSSTVLTGLTKAGAVFKGVFSKKSTSDLDADLEQKITDFVKNAKEGADNANTEADKAKTAADKAKTAATNAADALAYFNAITTGVALIHTDIISNIEKAKYAVTLSNSAATNAEQFKIKAAAAKLIVETHLNSARLSLAKITSSYVNIKTVTALLDNAKTTHLKNATDSNNAAIESTRLANESALAAKKSSEAALLIAARHDPAAAKAATAAVATNAASNSLETAKASHKLATTTTKDIQTKITLYEKAFTNKITPALNKCAQNITTITGLTKALTEKDTTQYNADYTTLDTLEQAFHAKVTALQLVNDPLKDLYTTARSEFDKAVLDYTNARTTPGVTTLTDPNVILTNISKFTDSNADTYTTRIKTLVDAADTLKKDRAKIKTDLDAAIAANKTIPAAGTPPVKPPGGPPGTPPVKPLGGPLSGGPLLAAPPKTLEELGLEYTTLTEDFSQKINDIATFNTHEIVKNAEANAITNADNIINKNEKKSTTFILYKDAIDLYKKKLLDAISIYELIGENQKQYALLVDADSTKTSVNKADEHAQQKANADTLLPIYDTLNKAITNNNLRYTKLKDIIDLHLQNLNIKLEKQQSDLQVYGTTYDTAAGDYNEIKDRINLLNIGKINSDAYIIYEEELDELESNFVVDFTSNIKYGDYNNTKQELDNLVTAMSNTEALLRHYKKTDIKDIDICFSTVMTDIDKFAARINTLNPEPDINKILDNYNTYIIEYEAIIFVYNQCLKTLNFHKKNLETSLSNYIIEKYTNILSINAQALAQKQTLADTEAATQVAHADAIAIDLLSKADTTSANFLSDASATATTLLSVETTRATTLLSELDAAAIELKTSNKKLFDKIVMEFKDIKKKEFKDNYTSYTPYHTNPEIVPAPANFSTDNSIYTTYWKKVYDKMLDELTTHIDAATLKQEENCNILNTKIAKALADVNINKASALKEAATAKALDLRTYVENIKKENGATAKRQLDTEALAKLQKKAKETQEKADAVEKENRLAASEIQRLAVIEAQRLAAEAQRVAEEQRVAEANRVAEEHRVAEEQRLAEDKAKQRLATANRVAEAQQVAEKTKTYIEIVKPTFLSEQSHLFGQSFGKMGDPKYEQLGESNLYAERGHNSNNRSIGIQNNSEEKEEYNPNDDPDANANEFTRADYNISQQDQSELVKMSKLNPYINYATISSNNTDTVYRNNNALWNVKENKDFCKIADTDASPDALSEEQIMECFEIDIKQVVAPDTTERFNTMEYTNDNNETIYFFELNKYYMKLHDRVVYTYDEYLSNVEITKLSYKNQGTANNNLLLNSDDIKNTTNIDDKKETLYTAINDEYLKHEQQSNFKEDVNLIINLSDINHDIIRVANEFSDDNFMLLIKIILYYRDNATLLDKTNTDSINTIINLILNRMMYGIMCDIKKYDDNNYHTDIDIFLKVSEFLNMYCFNREKYTISVDNIRFRLVFTVICICKDIYANGAISVFLKTSEKQHAKSGEIDRQIIENISYINNNEFKADTIGEIGKNSFKLFTDNEELLTCNKTTMILMIQLLLTNLAIYLASKSTSVEINIKSLLLLGDDDIHKEPVNVYTILFPMIMLLSDYLYETNFSYGNDKVIQPGFTKIIKKAIVLWEYQICNVRIIRPLNLL